MSIYLAQNDESTFGEGSPGRRSTGEEGSPGRRSTGEEAEVQGIDVCVVSHGVEVEEDMSNVRPAGTNTPQPAWGPGEGEVHHQLLACRSSSPSISEKMCCACSVTVEPSTPSNTLHLHCLPSVPLTLPAELTGMATGRAGGTHS